ncbi:hypothetical protein GDO78_021940 [Eleutherodactylus coqui]|uniref:Uncharacterized protein n=1 Tax=Eleutherodactylus coqui TaxID=57060 RepID=A0A8J6E9Q8_ELECQ|nr:hypothetical protein GDO78_021940 [Eleutherodactylus coqui]
MQETAKQGDQKKDAAYNNDHTWRLTLTYPVSPADHPGETLYIFFGINSRRNLLWSPRASHVDPFSQLAMPRREYEVKYNICVLAYDPLSFRLPI